MLVWGFLEEIRDAGLLQATRPAVAIYEIELQPEGLTSGWKHCDCNVTCLPQRSVDLSVSVDTNGDSRAPAVRHRNSLS